MTSRLPLLLLCSACWKLDTAELPLTALDFAPAAGGPEGWMVTPYTFDLTCPDGEPSRWMVVHPVDTDPETTVMPVAVVLHSGAFDFVLAPLADDPLTGPHFAEPSRLEMPYGVRQAFTTLGMYPAEGTTEIHDGTLVAALAERGVASLVPANCWGDLWHNSRGTQGNDFAADYFFRDGRTAAEWAFRLVAEPTFGTAFGLDLPFVPDPAAIYVIGLGDGGRGAAEILSVDVDRDGDHDLHPTAVLVDSTADDLRPYFDDPAAYGNQINGLLRIFPDGEAATKVGALFTSELPARLGIVYGLSDPEVPAATLAPLLGVADQVDDLWVAPYETEAHVLLNGADPAITEAALDWLLGPQP